MSLAKGTRLGHYEVLELIGKGGMCEVYRGYDTQLKRDVALKVLPEQFSRDSERLARFRREATMLASLNHPNIAAIYRLEQSGDTVALVMEYVSGETLADRVLREGAVPLDESLDITKQICEALEHAHEKSIIHRDLKPANVKLTPEGRVKVLDFGLAKAFAAEPGDIVPDSQAPTLPPGASPTIPGAILGTPAYMSPEQARGKQVDRRTDIFALGCVLFEMLTGKPSFKGESVTDTLGAVMHKEPEWALIPANTPPGIRTLLRRCLQKDASRRLRSAADFVITLDDAPAASESSPAVIASGTAPGPLWRRALPWAVTALLLVSTGVLALLHFRHLAPELGAVRVSVLAPENTAFPLDAVPEVSPDGRRLAFVARNSEGKSLLWVRSLDSLAAQSLPGTEDARQPFWSPDSRYLGFYTQN